jgi:AraC-like DNA-binding protein
MASPEKSHLLPSLLRDRIIPWASDNVRQRIIVARPRMSAAELPNGVQMKRRKLRGKRIIVRGQRYYAGVRISSAEWPDEMLEELEVPKLVCVVDGRADYHVGKYLLTCNAGHFIFVPPKIPHDGYRPHLEGNHKQDGFCELLQIVSYRHSIHCMICRSRGAEHAHVKGENYLIRDKQTLDLFHLMMAEAVACRENYELIYGNLLATFMLFLQREINAGHYLLPGPRTPHEPSAPSSNDFLTELDRYVSAHMGERLTLESVARQMCLSRSQFACRVREQTGKTFIAYLTDRRLDEAQNLLRESEWASRVIAEFVGIEPNYFHRVFRERKGMTPGNFRLKARKNGKR